MSPAIWIVRSRGLVSAQGAAPIRIQPHRKPRAGRLVVESNRIAKGIGKGAATAAIGHPGEGQSAVGGNRQARVVVAVRASGVVVRDQYLVGVIRVSPSVCLRLNNVRSGLRPCNQVYVHAAIAQGCHEVVQKLGERTGTAGFVRFAASCGLAAENHNRAGSEVFHLVDAQLVNLGTVKSRRDKRADLLGLGGNPIFLLRLLGRQLVRLCRSEQRQRDAGQPYEQAD